MVSSKSKHLASESFHIQPSALAVYQTDAPYDANTDPIAKATWKRY
jgi:hypothetical protein